MKIKYNIHYTLATANGMVRSVEQIICSPTEIGAVLADIASPSRFSSLYNLEIMAVEIIES